MNGRFSLLSDSLSEPYTQRRTLHYRPAPRYLNRWGAKMKKKRKIVELSGEYEYEELYQAGEIDPDTIYFIHSPEDIPEQRTIGFVMPQRRTPSHRYWWTIGAIIIATAIVSVAKLYIGGCRI